VCAPGYGVPTSKPLSTNVSDCELCPHGSYQAGKGLRCSLCPSTTFNHPVGPTYVSSGTTFTTGLSTPNTCTPRYAQLPSPAGARLAISPQLFVNAGAQTTLQACVESCPVHACCVAQWELASAGDELGACVHAVLPPVGPDDTEARLYYKLPPSELVSSASKNGSVAAKTRYAGIYTRCRMGADWVTAAVAGLIGPSPNNTLIEETDAAAAVEWGSCTTEAACRARCEADAACWGIIFVPGRGFALRGGEDQLLVRSFLVSPDLSKPWQFEQPPAPKCPQGKGSMFDCEKDCPEATYNDGSFTSCQPCATGQTSQPGSASCFPIPTTSEYRHTYNVMCLLRRYYAIIICYNH
jgi:Tyrosine-protein kinase ephrin type A/B receptor-like